MFLTLLVRLTAEQALRSTNLNCLISSPANIKVSSVLTEQTLAMLMC